MGDDGWFGCAPPINYHWGLPGGNTYKSPQGSADQKKSKEPTFAKPSFLWGNRGRALLKLSNINPFIHLTPSSLWEMHQPQGPPQSRIAIKNTTMITRFGFSIFLTGIEDNTPLSLKTHQLSTLLYLSYPFMGGDSFITPGAHAEPIRNQQYSRDNQIWLNHLFHD